MRTQASFLEIFIALAVSTIVVASDKSFESILIVVAVLTTGIFSAFGSSLFFKNEVVLVKRYFRKRKVLNTSVKGVEFRHGFQGKATVVLYLVNSKKKFKGYLSQKHWKELQTFLDDKNIPWRYKS